MDFATPTHVSDLLSRIRTFMEAEVYPLELQAGDASWAETDPLLNGLRAQVKELGLWAPPHSQEYGGMGLSLMEFAHVSEVHMATVARHVLREYGLNVRAD